MVTSQPEVSVIVPTRNRRPLLEQTLGSILRQTVSNIEVIVIDDASTDDTQVWLREHPDPRLRTITNQRPINGHMSRNKGASLARSPVLAFCDDDDLWAPDKLRRQLDAMRRTGSGWAASAAIDFDTHGRLLTLDPAPPEGDIAPQILARNVIPGGASNAIMEAGLFERAGRFAPDIVLMCDWYLYTSIALLAPIATVREPLVLYRQHNNSLSVELPFREELAKIDDRFRDAREIRGVRLDRGHVYLWTYRRYVRAGARHRALKAAWDGWRSGAISGARALRCSAVAVAPKQALPRTGRGAVASPTWVNEILVGA